MHGLNLWFLAGSGFFITWDLDWNCDGFLAFFGGAGAGGGEGGVISQAAFLPASYLVPRPLTIQVNLTKKKDRREFAAVTNQKLFARRLKTL